MMTAAYWGTTLGIFAGLFIIAHKLQWPLWLRILTAFFAGVVAGSIFGDTTQATEWVGHIFIRLIRMLLVPLVFTTVAAGVVALGEPRKLASVGGRTICLVLGTTAMAVIISVLIGMLIRPGIGADFSVISEHSASDAAGRLQASKTASTFVDRLVAIVPENPIQAFVAGDVLATIFFAVLFGAGVLLSGEKGRPIAAFLSSAVAAIIQIALLIMKLAPYGVYALVAWVTGVAGLGMFEYLLKLTIAVYGACLLQVLLVHGGLVQAWVGVPLDRYFKGIANAQAVAFSSASSAATLPVTISSVADNLGCSRSIAGSVLPVCATINKNGTAIYIALVALFTAQAFGISLGWVDYGMIVLTTTLVSLGGGGVPGGALFLAAMVLSTIGATAEQITLVIALIFPFDRLFDMMRTLTNVTGDTVVTLLVAKWEEVPGAA